MASHRQLHIAVVVLLALSVADCCDVVDLGTCATVSCTCPGYMACMSAGRGCISGCTQNPVLTTESTLTCQSANVAPAGHATQGPGTWAGYDASRAIDGNPNPRLDGGSCAHPEGTTSWWQVEWANDYVIQSVNITNRSDYQDRLSYTHIYVVSYDGMDTLLECYNLQYIGEVTYVWVKCTTPQQGHAVRLQRHQNAFENNVMHFCEIAIYGYQACAGGTWGVDCINTCACQDANENCSASDGYCQSGCAYRRVGTGCDIVLPVLNTPPRLVSASPGSLRVAFDAWSGSNGGGAPPTGYWVQYRLTSDDDWITGVDVIHTDALDYTATLSVVGTDAYFIQIVPYYVYEGTTYGGVSSPEAGPYTPLSLPGTASLSPSTPSIIPTLSSHPILMRTSPRSLVIGFDAWSPTLDAGEVPAGYWVQYKLSSATSWTTGATVDHTDSQAYTATLSGLELGYYVVRVVPYIIINGVQVAGTPSPEAGPYTPGAASATSGLSSAAIAGIAVSVLLFVGIIALLIYFKRNAIMKMIAVTQTSSKSNMGGEKTAGMDNPSLTPHAESASTYETIDDDKLEQQGDGEHYEPVGNGQDVDDALYEAPHKDKDGERVYENERNEANQVHAYVNLD